MPPLSGGRGNSDALGSSSAGVSAAGTANMSAASSSTSTSMRDAAGSSVPECYSKSSGERASSSTPVIFDQLIDVHHVIELDDEVLPTHGEAAGASDVDLLETRECLPQEHAAAVTTERSMFADVEMAIRGVSSHPTLMLEHIIPGDGNCGFRAVALAATGSEDNHTMLREAAVEAIMINANAYFMEDLQSWSSRMRKIGSECDELSLVGLSDVLERPIVVWFHGDLQRPPWVFAPAGAQACDIKEDEIISLLFREKSIEGNPGAYSGHYNLLLPPPPRANTPGMPSEMPRRGRKRRGRELGAEEDSEPMVSATEVSFQHVEETSLHFAAASAEAVDEEMVERGGSGSRQSRTAASSSFIENDDPGATPIGTPEGEEEEEIFNSQGSNDGGATPIGGPGNSSQSSHNEDSSTLDRRELAWYWHEAGMAQSEIAEVFGVTEQLVSKWLQNPLSHRSEIQALHEQGMSPESIADAQGSNEGGATPIGDPGNASQSSCNEDSSTLDWRELAWYWHEAGKTASDIAETVGVNKRTVQRWLQKLRSHRSEIKVLHEQGMSPESIADTLGIGRATVYRHLPAVPDEAPSMDPCEEAWYWNQAGRTTSEIAEAFGVSRKTVSQWLSVPRGSRWADADAMRREGASLQQIANVANVTQQAASKRMRYKPRTGTAVEAWKSEHEETFAIPPRDIPAAEAPVAATGKQQKWMAESSWTSCPKCGLRRPAGKYNPARQRSRAADVSIVCDPCCDERPEALEVQRHVRPKKNPAKKLMGYITPRAEDWPAVIKNLSKEDAMALSVIRLDAEYKAVRGGRAPVTNLKKTALVRGRWRTEDVRSRLVTQPQKDAFDWLMEHNTTYNWYVKQHRALLRWRAEEPSDDAEQETWQRLWPAIPTAELLLKMPAVEVAARPWLYPTAPFGDTDIKIRLGLIKKQLAENAMPDLKASFTRKLLSRCVSYEEDFPLQCLVHDISLAKQLQGISWKAAELKMAPDALPKTQNFANFWMDEKEKLEDMCRQHNQMPNLFFTVAPAEWKFPKHLAMSGWRTNEREDPNGLSNGQVTMALHMYHCLDEIIEGLLDDERICQENVGIEEVHDYALRFEYQGRGTIHVHVVAWVKLKQGVFHDPAQRLSGKSGKMHNSSLVTFLEDVFKASVDVQCGQGEHCLLRYVTGYVSKASDALSFKPHIAAESGDATSGASWRQIYRMLCKNAPLQQEMAVQFAAKALIKSSFRGDNIFAPLPGSKAVNNSRHYYNEYLKRPQAEDSMAFIEWARMHKVTSQKKDNEIKTDVAKRGEHGRGKNKKRTALGVRFHYEMLDIYIGGWLATFVPHRCEDEFLFTEEEKAKIPYGAYFLKAALRHERFGGDVDRLLDPILEDLQRRGVNKDRRMTFSGRIQAAARLLQRNDVDAASWSVRSPTVAFPERQWSPQQKQLLDTVDALLLQDDANGYNSNARNIFVTGCPGTGKTEVLIECALRAARSGAKVLIACPTALLQDTYSTRMPYHENITVETVHSTFRITRDADEVYVPPGRLRHLDVIIFDEISTLDGDVWRKVKTALAELCPTPIAIWAGDFSQLQSVTKETTMQDDILREVAAGHLQRVELLQHAFARSNDTALLEFLAHVRCHQPSRDQVVNFFRGRRLDSKPENVTREALRLENQRGKRFTILTVTNAAAGKYNAARLQVEFPEAYGRRDRDGVPGDPTTGGGNLVFVEGMRIRLTRNVDKQRGFVNGALGVIERLLRKDIFVMKTMQNVRILVHPVRFNDLSFMPVTYAYATTMRRAQGSTLEMGGLRFDRRRPDRGYAYVGASRFKQQESVFHIGHFRQSDWLPVGGDPNNEHVHPGDDSSDTNSDDEENTDSEYEPSSEVESEDEPFQLVPSTSSGLACLADLDALFD